MPRYFAITVLLVVRSAAQPPVSALPEPPPAVDRNIFEGFDQLSGLAGRIDWEEERGFIEVAIDHVWQRNGWNDEADRFARDLACEIAAIPPWEPMRRLNVLTDRVTKRYGVSGKRALELKGMLLREAGRFTLRNAPVLLRQAREYLETRANGEPFAPAQVARWSREGQPVLTDLHRIARQLSKEWEPILAPEGRRRLRRDMKSFEKRQRYVERMMVQWVQGKWQPRDWGLEDTPMYPDGASPQRAVSRRDRAVPEEASRGAVPDRMPRCVPYDPSTWMACVLAFQTRYGLDAGQISAAESVHAELYARAKAYSESHAEALGPVPRGARAADTAYEPIRALFRELQRRLDAIPTSGQREQAKE